MSWQLILILLTTFFLLLLLLPLRINILYKRKHIDDLLIVRLMTLFNLTLFSIEVPLASQETPFDITLDAKVKAAGKKTVKESKSKYFLRDINPLLIKRLAHFLYRRKKEVQQLAGYLQQIIIIDFFEVKVNYGFQDPSLTGKLYGLYYAIVPYLSICAERRFRWRRKPDLSFTPLFDDCSAAEARLEASLSLRLYHMFVLGMITLIKMWPGRGEIKVWRNILSKG